MRTVHYSDILRGSASMAGLGKDDVGDAEFALYREGHDTWLQRVWEAHRWPDICRTEQRYFRPKWNASATYNQGDQRFDLASMAYYQSVQNVNVGNPPTTAGVVDPNNWALCQVSYNPSPWVTGVDYAVGAIVQSPDDGQAYYCILAHTSLSTFAASLSDWCLLIPFNRYVAYEQTEDDGTIYTPLGEVFAATDKDPRITTRTTRLRFELSNDGLQFHLRSACEPYAWLQYRLRRPELTGEPYDSTAVYTSGQQVYYVCQAGAAQGQGDFYTVTTTTTAGDTPESQPGSFSVVQLPYFCRKALVAGGHAAWLEDDGEDDKAARWEGNAEMALEQEIDKLTRQQQQAPRLDFVPC